MNIFLIIFLTALLALVASYWLLPGIWARLIIQLRRRRGGLSSQSVEVAGRRWHYLEGGSGHETLVLLHGFGADADHWVEISRSLGREFRLIAPDTPGFGETELTEGYDFSIPSQVDVLLEFLNAMGIDECHLAGNSMGGYMAAELAARQPERIKTLWLLAPFGMESADESETQKAIRTGEDSPFTINTVKQFEHRVMNRMFGRPQWLPYPLIHHLAHEAFDRLEMGARAYNHIVEHSPSLESIAPRITTPTLIQWGTADQVTDASGAESLANAIPRSHLVLQLGTGHLPMLEQPGDSVDIFLHFLNHGVSPSVSQADPIIQS